MRIIAGKLKGRKLMVPEGTQTRPTTDRHRETMFNTLGQFFDGGVALDAFAGSGALGIEAYSRGIDQVVSIEKHPKSHQVLMRNLKALNIENHITLHKMDALLFLTQTPMTFDLILLDPPYHHNLANQALETIAKRQLLKDEGMILIETAKDETINVGNFQVIKEKHVGQSKLIILA